MRRILEFIIRLTEWKRDSILPMVLPVCEGPRQGNAEPE